MKNILALTLACLLVLPRGIAAEEKRGADLLVEMLDGMPARGELIAVKESSLLLLDRDSGADVSVLIKDVRVIKIMQKSKTWSGAGLGLLVGASLGVITGLVIDKTLGKKDLFWGPEHSALAGGAIGGLGGALGGGMIGAHVSRPETLMIAGKSKEEINSAKESLRSKARVPDYR